MGIAYIEIYYFYVALFLCFEISPFATKIPSSINFDFESAGVYADKYVNSIFSNKV